MTVAIFLSFIIILPSVSLSLFYISSLLGSLTVITDTDVRIGRMATDLSITMLETRRYERNFRLFGNPSDRDHVHTRLATADSMLTEMETAAPQSYGGTFKDLSEYLDIYTNSFSSLEEHVAQNPPEQRLTDLSRNLTEFQETYRRILQEVEDASEAERDSIMAEKIAAMDEQTLNMLSLTESPGEPVYILENLEQSRQSFLESAHTLATMSWDSMQEHKRESQMIEARANRNLITVLIITALAGVMMLRVLPRYIMRPLTSLNRIFVKAREGDLSAYATVQSNDEIGDLASSYNQMIERMRLYDGLKTRKIASQKRAVDRLLEQIETPACILTAELKAVFYNSSFATLFGKNMPKRAPEGGLDISTLDTMEQFAAALKKKLAMTSNNFSFSCSVDGGQITFQGRMVRNAVMEPESIVLIAKSQPVAADGA